MTVPSLSLTSDSPSSVDADVLLVGVNQTDSGPRLTLDGDEWQPLREALAAIGVTGAQDEVRRIPFQSVVARSVALVGLGSGPATPDTLRYAAGSAARQLVGVDSVCLALPAQTPEAVLAVLEGAAIGAYRFAAYRRTSLEGDKAPAGRFVLCADAAAELVERATITAEAVHLVRDLVNTPAADLYPETFAERVESLAADLPVKVAVLREPELEAGGYGGHIAVGRGSSRGPRLVTVRYEPEGAGKHLALVGKGITFDSGGLSLKPASAMVGMKYDMTGAATVLAVTLAAARLALPVRISAWLCLAENMPSGTASRPNDVIAIRGGTTVEVLNTDAEGRLVLADGIAAASEETPDAIVDVATLTGAAAVALGNRYVGTMGDETLVAQVVEAASACGETLWPMPLPGELRSVLNSEIADIANAKPGHSAGGMLLGGMFLKEFVGKSGQQPDAARIPWAHLDVANAASNGGSPYGFNGKGATGVAVRALLSVAERFSPA